MLLKWRVIKSATREKYDYVGIEFDMQTGDMTKQRIYNRDTTIRKRRTVEFEMLELNGSGNQEWMLVPYKEVHSLMRDFNNLRRRQAMIEIMENELLTELYGLEALK